MKTPNHPPLLQRRDDPITTTTTTAAARKNSWCGNHCFAWTLSATVGVVCILLAVVALLVYRRRRNNNNEQVVSEPTVARPLRKPPFKKSQPLQHPQRAKLASSSSSQDTPDRSRKPSQAELAQMEVYRKMSVIGIV